MLLKSGEKVRVTVDLTSLTTTGTGHVNSHAGEVEKNEQFVIVVKPEEGSSSNRRVCIVFVFLLHTIRYEPTIMCIRPNRIDRRW
jgi:hypothetical protein